MTSKRWDLSAIRLVFETATIGPTATTNSGKPCKRRNKAVGLGGAEMVRGGIIDLCAYLHEFWQNDIL